MMKGFYSVACTAGAVIFLVSAVVSKPPERMQKYQTGLLFVILGFQIEQLKDEKE